MGGDGPRWQESYEDPLRWKLPASTTELKSSGTPQIQEGQNDLCSVKWILMHRPTHDPQREKTGEYPFSWHLSGRRRLWELRVQLKFHQLPQGQVYFGVELDRFVPVSGMARQAQKALVSACNKIVGDCYHTTGEDPSQVQGEAESPAFVMPLWAFDQFTVSEPGKEPGLLGNLDGVGVCRTAGVNVYIKSMKDVLNNLSTDKVYTFCFWGVSKFLDIMKWEVCGGLMPGVKMDFNKLCGSPPVYVTLYSLPGVNEQDTDKRHLQSRKRQYFRVEFWSALRPPLAAGAQVPVVADMDFDYWSGMGGLEDLVVPSVKQQSEDLLGLCDPPEKSSGAKVPGVQKVENCDLLGLDLLS